MPDDDLVQANFQQLKKPPSPARPRLLQDTARELMQQQGRLSLVTGQSGQGKTAFLVRGPRGLGRREGGLCVLKRAKEAGRRKLVGVNCDHAFCSLPPQASLVSALQALDGAAVAPLVFFHFSGARPDHSLALTLIRRLCAYLHGRLEEPGALPSTYRCVSPRLDWPVDSP